MPCDASHMEPTPLEVELSKVLCCLDELNETGVIKESWWKGYHPLAYTKNISLDTLNKLTASLCSQLKKVTVANYSLNLQMWVKDHEDLDKLRQQKAKQERQKKAVVERALKKLTPIERRALGH